MAADLNRLLKDYRYYLRMERKMSPNTVASYCSDVELFLESADPDVRTTRSDEIAAFLSERADEVSKRSQSRRLSALRSFFDWLIMEGERADIGRAAAGVQETRRAMYDSVPVWHVPQAFNWAWDTYRSKSKLHRYPTAEELVSMTWQPIAAGANGLIYYAFHRICMATKGPERDECLRLAAAAAAEVKAKMPILLSEPGPAIISAPEGMVCRTWRTADGKVALLAANTTRRAVAGTVALADGTPPLAVELPPLGHVFKK